MALFQNECLDVATLLWVYEYKTLKPELYLSKCKAYIWRWY